MKNSPNYNQGEMRDLINKVMHKRMVEINEGLNQELDEAINANKSKEEIYDIVRKYGEEKEYLKWNVHDMTREELVFQMI